MHTLVDMRKPKKEVEEAKMPEPGLVCDHDMYPYGLEGSLEEDGIDKMGIDLTDVAVGEKVLIHAVAEVTEVRQTERQGHDGEKKTERCLRWQIQKLSLKFPNNYEDSFDEAAKKKDD
jgi:hypothetical protein